MVDVLIERAIQQARIDCRAYECVFENRLIQVFQIDRPCQLGARDTKQIATSERPTRQERSTRSEEIAALERPTRSDRPNSSWRPAFCVYERGHRVSLYVFVNGKKRLLSTTLHRDRLIDPFAVTSMFTENLLATFASLSYEEARVETMTRDEWRDCTDRLVTLIPATRGSVGLTIKIEDECFAWELSHFGLIETRRETLPQGWAVLKVFCKSTGRLVQVRLDVEHGVWPLLEPFWADWDEQQKIVDMLFASRLIARCHLMALVK